MVTNFFSSKNSKNVSTMYTKRDDIETTIGGETDKIIEEIFEYLL